jgi:predicted Na+-dependent transporter
MEVRNNDDTIHHDHDYDDDDDDDEEQVASDDSLWIILYRYFLSIKKFIIDNFLISCFAIALIIAMSAPAPGEAANKILVGEYQYKIISFLNTCIVFFISGLALNLQDLKDFIKYYKLFLIGIIQINFVTTLIALFFLNTSFIKEDYRKGFAIFNTVPTTLGVGVTLTQLAKGDGVLSLLMTVASNILGTITIPFLLDFYFQNSNLKSSTNNSIQIDTMELILSLVFSVLIPTLVGIVCRNSISTVAVWAKTYKQELGMFSSMNLACIVWMALSVSRELLLEQSASDILLVLCFAIVIHVLSLSFHHLVCTLFGVSRAQAISLTIMSSQKSSPVALAVITGMGVDCLLFLALLDNYVKYL